MKKFFNEFKDFAFKGNVVDLAVGMMIGSAFTGIVKSVVDDLVMPLLSLLTGKIRFEDKFIALDGKSYATLAEATDAGVSVFKYGNFISAFINFIIISLVIFLFLKLLLKLKRPKAVPETEPTTKVCPYCKSEISIEAVKCPHCTSEL